MCCCYFVVNIVSQSCFLHSSREQQPVSNQQILLCDYFEIDCQHMLPCLGAKVASLCQSRSFLKFSPVSFTRLFFTTVSIMAATSDSLKLSPPGTHDLVMDPFCIRQFNNPSYLGTQVQYDVQEFENKVNEYYRSGNYPLKDGYAPFWLEYFLLYLSIILHSFTSSSLSTASMCLFPISRMWNVVTLKLLMRTER